MILKSICLQGFKSFPERTLIQFHEGVTAIVGPNGSGKSNVTDAIRWVLGEQSVKTLRTAKMEELIFSGTQTRRPLSYAEVTLTMDNSDRSLPLDYPEIRVSRRIYRSGESEYLINDSRCRLKDIHELFLDTGIGRDGYSMIGQGRVDDILSGKAELRRKMLDEASGITKYKLRREEAEKKLAHTEQNLIRLNDIMQELEKQKGPLERQAKKARTFLTYHEALKAADLALLYFDIDAKEADSQKLSHMLEELNRNLADAEANKAKIMQNAADCRLQMQEASETADRLQADEEAAREELSAHEKNLALATQQIEQITKRQERYIHQSAELNERITRLEAEEKAKSEEFAALDHESLEVRETLARAEEQCRQAQRDMQANQLLRQTLEEEGSRNREQLSGIRQTIRSEETNQEVLKSHLARLDRDLADLSTELNSGESESNRVAEQLDKVKEAMRGMKASAEEAEKRREQKRVELSLKEKALRDTGARLENLRYQHKTQQELAAGYEGYSFTVKHLMEYAKKAEPEVHGPLADLLRVPQKYEAAIESILGASAQHIVVQSEETGRRMINKLKEKHWGRATFLPLNRVQGGRPPEKLLMTARRMKGYLGLADELVAFDPVIQPAAAYALGRTVVTETLDDAVAIARATEFKLRLASLDGDILNPGGSMSGGSRKQQSSGILGRSRLLEDLAKEIAEKTERVTETQAELRRLADDMAGDEAELGKLSAELSRLNNEQILLGSQLNQYESVRIRLQSKHDQNRADFEKLMKEQSESSAELMTKKTRELEALSVLAQIDEQKKDLAAQLEKQAEVLNELVEQRNNLKLKLTRSSERGETAKQLLFRVRQELSQVREELEVQELDLTRDNAESQKLMDFIADGSAARERLSERAEDLKIRVAAAVSRRNNANSALAEASDALAAVSSHLTRLGQEQGRLEQRAENAAARLLELRGRLWEDYACTFANKDEWYKPDLDPAASREEVKTLRQQIKALGSVNVQAIEESKELNERFEYMDKQREDILTARKDLEKVIEDITAGMQKQFRESFSFINTQFSIAFKQLFGGGEAELVLENKQDILNSEIDIKVSPPGKRLQNMLALSGGERCLTAIALLFAIQKLNPSPFCVLDEVEAALDEANVFRFTDYINMNADKTQYILVTHRRGTMEAARMIYGVTMQERGVSQIISVRLDEQ